MRGPARTTSLRVDPEIYYKERGDLESLADDGTAVVQYDWTWTTLLGPDTETPTPDLDYTLDNLGPMQVRYTNYHEAIRGERLSVRYSGEPPRVLGVVRAPSLESGTDPLYEMLALRILDALEDRTGRKRYFLIQELEFNRHFSEVASNKQRLQAHIPEELLPEATRRFLDPLTFRARNLTTHAFRIPQDFLDNLSDHLQRCHSDRRQSAEPTHRNPLGSALGEYALAMTRVFRGALPGGGPAAWDAAHNEFAAGGLTQHARVKSLAPLTDVGPRYRAGEPDSSAVMFYAELALAMHELAESYRGDGGEDMREQIDELGRFWRGLLNSMVQMQAVYLHRYSRVFTDCAAAISHTAPRATDYEAVVAPIRGLRAAVSTGPGTPGEIAMLRQYMHAHARYTTQHGNPNTY